MKKNFKLFLCILIMLSNIFTISKVNAETNTYKNNILKVGVIELEPYVTVYKDGSLGGYYIDLFNLISNKLNIKYEYVLIENEKAIESLENEELDLLLGATITEDRSNRVIFNVNAIGTEKFAIYTNNKNISSYKLEDLNGLRFGTVKEVASEWILNFFKLNNINVDVIYGESHKDINKLLDEGKLDLVLDSAYKKNNYKKIYEFVDSQVYIAANKKDRDLLDSIDNVISEINRDDNQIENLYNSYFDKDKIKEKKVEYLLSVTILSILLILITIVILIILRNKIHKYHIKKLMKSKEYSVYYDSVYNLRNKELVAVEALVKDKSSSIVYSKDFIMNNRKNIIVFEMCIWMLERIIEDYCTLIERYKIKSENFHICINIPIDQFKNKKLINKIIKIKNKFNLPQNLICIGIIGSIAIKNYEEILNNLKIIKKEGFLLSIDDFGIENSNLDIIESLEIDFIKVDSSFTKNIDKSFIKRQIIIFISRISKSKNIPIILDGIYEKEQEIILKDIDNEKLYVKGKFYGESFTINKNLLNINKEYINI